MNESLKHYGLKTNIVDMDTMHEVAKEVLDKAAKAVATTYGPAGSHSMYAQLPRESAKFTKDGISVLEGIIFQGSLEHSLYKYVLESSRKVNRVVGDGTTTAFLATNELYKNLYSAIINKKFVVDGKSLRPHNLANGLRVVTNNITERILKNSVKIDFEDEKALEVINRIAYISLNNDKETSDILMEAYREVGINGEIDIQISSDDQYHIQKNAGYRLDYGYFSSVFANTDEASYEAENCRILLFNGIPNNLEHEELIKAIIVNHNEAGIPLTIIVGGFSARMSNYIHKLFHFASQNVSRRNVINIIQLPMVTKNNQERILDLSILLGAKIINVENNFLPGFEEMSAEEYFKINIKEKIGTGLEELEKQEYYGQAKVVSYNDYTLLNNVKGEENPILVQRLEEIINNIKRKLSEPNRNELEIANLRARKAFLEKSLVTLFIGGETDVVKKARADLFDDAIRAIKASKAYGYSRGCNLEIILACNELINEIDEEIKNNINDLESLSASKLMTTIIRDSFISLYKIILSSYYDEDGMETIINTSILEKKPFDITTFSSSDNVINPTLTDLLVLDTAISVVADLLITKQFILSVVEDNIYM
ncbi:hypothetical protein DLH72_04515 [Candidatus Gracilibacteria bacterium]|nr:MAG: hypothetical protein DLH72_04515 [Candidatus Gracilibacteria bacterium]